MLVSVVVLLGVTSLACAEQPGGQRKPEPAAPDSRPVAVTSAEPIVGLWVNRWDYKTQDDIEQVMSRAASLKVTDVFWQVRGQADAYYPSALEPWGEEICTKSADGLRPPAFDPLRVAVERAHSRGLRIHAWFNVMPMWKGLTPPASPRHMYYTRPEWRVHDATGKAQALNDHYITVDFTLPEVQEHIVAVAKDLVTRYSLDGLHLDYVRFVSESSSAKLRLLEDRGVLERFARETGADVSSIGSAQTRARLIEWRRGKITKLVKAIREQTRAIRPGLALTAAVWRTPQSALDYEQDAARWLNDGTLDRAFPMIYTPKDDEYARDLDQWLAACPGKAVCPGIGIYMHTPGASAFQIARSRQSCPSGYALYAYASLFESADPKQDRKPKDVQERAARLAAIKGILAPSISKR